MISQGQRLVQEQALADARPSENRHLGRRPASPLTMRNRATSRTVGNRSVGSPAMAPGERG